MTTSIGTSLVRTITPVVVGNLLTWLLALGIDGIDGNDLTTVVSGALTIVYYALARWLETHVSSRFGVLLGSARQPAYTAPDRHVPLV